MGTMCAFSAGVVSSCRQDRQQPIAARCALHAPLKFGDRRRKRPAGARLGTTCDCEQNGPRRLQRSRTQRQLNKPLPHSARARRSKPRLHV
eukprot:scaffold49742_cov60-Phaeocystis_antarctica.AAC.2